MFQESSVNERIKFIYGNYNFWSWLKYWYLDTANQTALMAIDKQYYDYDYKEFEEKKKPEDYKPKSDKEVGNILRRFGLKTKMGKKSKEEEIQEAMRRGVLD